MGCRPARQRPDVGEGIGVARLSPARRVALALVGQRRRRDGRIRDIARESRQMESLAAADRALAFRLALGATAAQAALDQLLDARLRRPGAVEPRVRDALRIAAFEICYLDTPASAAVSQGVELVRSTSPRAAGLANAVLRGLAQDDRPRVQNARQAVTRPVYDVGDLQLASGLPLWLAGKVRDQRGESFARELGLAHLEPAPVCVAANGLRHDARELEALLAQRGLDPRPLAALEGSFELCSPSQKALAGLIDDCDLVVADASAQLVCRLAATDPSCDILEVGQGRGTKSLLLTTALGVTHPQSVMGIDSVGYKAKLSQRRMRVAGVDQVVTCHEFDGLKLASELPEGRDRSFSEVFVDAPCSGTGTMRRHPEIAASLGERDVMQLAELQLGLLKASSTRVGAGGTLVYSTCSVLQEEDEDVIGAFLSSDEGRHFAVQPVDQAPACSQNGPLRELTATHQTPQGYLLTTPTVGGGDGHFCARLVRVSG